MGRQKEKLRRQVEVADQIAEAVLSMFHVVRSDDGQLVSLGYIPTRTLADETVARLANALADYEATKRESRETPHQVEQTMPGPRCPVPTCSGTGEPGGMYQNYHASGLIYEYQRYFCNRCHHLFSFPVRPVFGQREPEV